MIEFNNFSSYFELMAGILVAFVGIKSFREEIYDGLFNRQKKQLEAIEMTYRDTKRIWSEKLEAIEIRFKDTQGLSSEKLLNRPQTETINKKLFIKFEMLQADFDKAGEIEGERSRSLLNLKYPLKITFIFSFVYCVFILLLMGFTKNIFTDNTKFQLLIFLNNILLMNSATSIFAFFTLKSKRVVSINFIEYLIGLVILFCINKLLSIYLNFEVSESMISVISVLIPISPFVFHFILEYVMLIDTNEKLYLKLTILKESMNDLFNEMQKAFDKIKVIK